MLDQTIDTIRTCTTRSLYEGRLFLVGGLLRDIALNLPPEEDVDIVCLCDALQVAAFLQQQKVTDHAPVVYPRFGTAMVGVGGIPVEFATARRESYSPESRKPVVEPATLEEDVVRRDFTVNTLLENLHTGQQLDLTGKAWPDLQARLIRTPLDPVMTFQDDPLRLLRAVRFAAKLDFRIEQETWRAVLQNASRLEIVSRERIRDELVRLLMLPRASFGLELLREATLLESFAPELAAMHAVPQNVFHIFDVWTHTLEAIGNLPADANLIVRLATLLHDVGKPPTRTVDEDGSVHFYGHQQVGAEMTKDILRRLKFPGDVVEQVARLVSLHMRIGEYNPGWGDSAVRRLIRDFGDQKDALFTIAEADKAACNPEYHTGDFSQVRARVEEVEQEADFAHVRSPLAGREIMEIAKIGPGPEVGRLKEMLVNEILEGRLAPEDTESAERILREALERERGG